MRIGILGWGSLLWDTDSEKGKVFLSTLKAEDPQKTWKKADSIERPNSGLDLNLEFSRVSRTRKGALTLVIDTVHCKDEDRSRVFCAKSRKTSVGAVVKDLAEREETPANNIGVWARRDDSIGAAGFRLKQIEAWAHDTEFDAVVWTNLRSNYSTKVRSDRFSPFAPDTASRYLKTLPHEVQREAVEYICRAPSTVDTALRRYLEKDEWYRLIVRELDIALRPVK